MKKAVKRIICIISAICVALSMLLVLDTSVLAATTPQKVHIGLKEFYAYDSNIEVKFSQGDYKVQNVKTSSKNLISRVTNIDATSSKRTYNKDNPWGYARIGLHAKKKGTYTVTFDVVDKNLNVVSSHSVKVYANNEVGVNKVIFAGKTSFTSLPPNLAYGQTAIGQSGSGAFKVSMNKGYSLKSITMVTYKKSGKEVRKKIKNGAKVTLGKYRYISEKTKSRPWRTVFAFLSQKRFFAQFSVSSYVFSVSTFFLTAFLHSRNTFLLAACISAAAFLSATIAILLSPSLKTSIKLCLRTNLEISFSAAMVGRFPLAGRR